MIEPRHVSIDVLERDIVATISRNNPESELMPKGNGSGFATTGAIRDSI
jgi:hypothetical protein